MVLLHRPLYAHSRLHQLHKMAFILGTSYMSGFRASKRILLRLGQLEALLSGEVEVDEVYQTAGLKGKNNSNLIKMLASCLGGAA